MTATVTRFALGNMGRTVWSRVLRQGIATTALYAYYITRPKLAVGSKRSWAM